MFRSLSFVMLTLAAMSATAQSPAARLIVSYRDGADSPAAQAANRAVGATLVRPLGDAKTALVQLPAGANAAQAMATLKAQPGVLDAQPDRRMRVDPIRGPKVRP